MTDLFYHCTWAAPFRRFKGDYVWLSDEPALEYGKNCALVEYAYSNPTDVTGEDGWDLDTLREQGYDFVVGEEGYAALYPKRIKILEWTSAGSPKQPIKRRLRKSRGSAVRPALLSSLRNKPLRLK